MSLVLPALLITGGLLFVAIYADFILSDDKKEGLKRKQIRKDKVIKNIYIPIDENPIKWLPPAEDMIFDKNVKSFGLDFIRPLLTKVQINLIEEIIGIVEKDRATLIVINFAWETNAKSLLESTNVI